MRESTIKKGLLILGMIFVPLLILIPVLWMVLLSFSGEPYFLANNVQFKLSLEGYRYVFYSKTLSYWTYMKNSLLVAIPVAIIVAIISSLAGYAISRLEFPGKKILPLVILAVSMFPPISIVGFLFETFANFGILDSQLALILPGISWALPFGLWVNLSYFSQIPLDLDKAALVDGASRTKILFKIIVPLAVPGIFATALLVFIGSFNELLFAMILTSTKNAQTIPIGISTFQGSYGETIWGPLMAASTLTTVPLILITIYFQKYIVGGLTKGSVKG